MPFHFCIRNRAFFGMVVAAGCLMAGRAVMAAPLYADGFEAGTGFSVESGNAGFNGGEGTSEGSSALLFNSGQATANAVVVRTFATTAGQQYLVQFDYGNFNTGQTTLQQVQAEFRDGSSSSAGAQLIDDLSGTITTVSGATITNDLANHVIRVADDSGGPNLGNTPAPNAELSAVSFTFTAASGSSTLVFRDQAAGGNDSTDGILDNVRITAVPEPGMVGVLGVAMVGLVGRFDRAHRGRSDGAHRGRFDGSHRGAGEVGELLVTGGKRGACLD